MCFLQPHACQDPVLVADTVQCILPKHEGVPFCLCQLALCEGSLVILLSGTSPLPAGVLENSMQGLVLIQSNTRNEILFLFF